MRTILSPFCCFVFLILASSTAFSQEEDFFNGQLIDSKTREPIAFATIRLKGFALGVISNEDGGFKIPDRFKDYGDMLKISSMGYQNKEIPITALAQDPPLIQINFTSINLEDGTFDIFFNLEPDKKEAAKITNYVLNFKGQELQFDALEVRKHVVKIAPFPIKEDKVSLHVKMDKIELSKMFNELSNASLQGGEEALKKLLSVQVVNLHDKEGNLIDEWTHRDFNQFREYFVQQVKPNNTAPADTLFMKKDIPIFKDQPVVKPDNFKDYWMNTPLKKY